MAEKESYRQLSEKPRIPEGLSLVLYDGACGLCNRFVRFVIKRDRKGRFLFAPLQGPFASEVLARHGKDPRDLDTVYLIVNPGGPREEALARGRAVRRVLSGLGGAWSAAGALLWIVPVALLDSAYRLIARNRYRWFGKHESCPIPSAEERRRFVDL
jgi:predicted DCC family thiol-disulfide oxidoreductase YuxK